MVEEVKKLKMKIVDFNKKQMKERIEKIKVETEKRIAEGMVQNRPILPDQDHGLGRVIGVRGAMVGSPNKGRY